MSELRSEGGPTAQQLDLFRAVEDLHEMTLAIVVLLTDADGLAIAVGGDEAAIPPPLRAVLSAKQLAAAGSVRALLEPVFAELGPSPLNVLVLAVDAGHVLTVVFDAEADFEVVQTVSREARGMIAEILAAN
ncbi:hypothetical protein AKJ09_03649 [Labilithrix luteola]|uniref:Roadblock/LAMTOR2 domain-containing protein n=1 Tax=Labilithrix luteola TaxID=1391654 RepID=A0A0K1PTX3_9BACT|nr:hypothetical protein [Labilithrix luteola]AKU96985.1 hypothetical protein AKJ09_03649 [Labilithrix luteola]